MIRRQIPPQSKFVLPVACVFALTTLAGPVFSADVTATRLDGTTVAGELRQWNDDEVRIATPAGDQWLDTKQLISLRWQPGASSPATLDKNSGHVELIDGSILPITKIGVGASKAALTLAGDEVAAAETIELPAEEISVVRFGQLKEPLAQQWEEIRRLKLATDVLAVLKKDGKSLDYVEGVLNKISDDKIDFKMDGKIQRVDRAKIAGVILYRPDRRTKDKPRATIEGRSGLRVTAMQVALRDNRLQLTIANGVKFSWPVDDIRLTDFSAGKLLYLSDIEAASEKWTPLVGLPPSATIAAEYGRPRRDKSAYGGPLALLTKEDVALAQAAPRTFNKGLALRSRTEIVYRLPAGFQRFIALAGIDPAASANGNVQLVIFGDDRVLLETEVAGDQPPQQIQLDIANVKRLKFLVDYGRNLDSGDWLNLCDARIVK